MPVYSGDGLRVRVKRIDGVTSRRISEGALETPFHFQCPPLDTFRVEYSHSHTDYETVGAGQVSRKGGRQLRTVTFDTLFVDWGNYAVAQLPGMAGDDAPSRMANAIDRLIEIVESGEPIQLTCSHEGGSFSGDEGVRAGALTELDMWATIRAFTHEERMGEGDTRYISLSFVEYVDPVVTRRTKRRKRRPKKWPVTHILRGDESMRELATTYYGAPEVWRPIAKANGFGRFSASASIVASTPLKVGAKIVIPEPPPIAIGSEAQETTSTPNGVPLEAAFIGR